MLDGVGVDDRAAQHLHPSADAYHEASGGLRGHARIQVLSAHPQEVIDGLLAAGQDNYVGQCKLRWLSAEAQGDRRLVAKSIEVGKVRKGWQGDNSNAQWPVAQISRVPGIHLAGCGD